MNENTMFYYDPEKMQVEDFEIEAAKQVPSVQFTYVNHANIYGLRTVHFIKMVYGVSKYYTEPQWLLVGWDVDKKAVRHYSLNKILSNNH